MPQLPVVRIAAATDLTGARDLVERIERDTGDRPLNDQSWIDLTHHDHLDGSFVAAVADAGGAIAGYAQAAREAAHWTLAVVEPPPGLSTDARDRLVRAVLEGVAACGGGDVQWWTTDPSIATEAFADEVGLTGRRRLLQMRRSLPTGSVVDLHTRPFVVGADDDEWLTVNNRAFAAHREQGSWDRETLAEREREPWFDPAGFLLHHREGRLAGFCWTKVHARTAPPLGEIYVIAVDPDFHGIGLGRALTLAGLDHLASRGLTTGMLYVDADNVGAVTMYERLGFGVHRTDVACIGHIAARRSEVAT